ncbi:Nudix family hydrolase [Halopseudomonas sp. Lyrl_26]|uniref:Nudix family hydrolase n=1 Tax=Halopseudomonas sp. Lyrl_26 TaxID=3110923 RepID=UPI003F7F434D
MRRIHVIAAVIRDDQSRILIAKRPDHVHQGGLWEFPGGKLEEGEQRFDGLVRELREELGITVTHARPLLDIRHDYPDKSVRLDVWLVTGFDGEAHGAEGQPVRWVTAAGLDEYEFPAANAPVVRAAQLPECYLITPDMNDEQALFAGLQRAREAGIRLVQLRQTQLSGSAYRGLVERVLERFGADFRWMLKGDEPPEWPGVGWHLTGRQLRGFVGASNLPLSPTLSREGRGSAPVLLAASCHDAEELVMAAELGVDFVTLSPVLPTQSHPGAAHLGWERARELIDSVNMPVYLLGGLGPQELSQAFEAGAQGVTGIRQLWELAGG